MKITKLNDIFVIDSGALNTVFIDTDSGVTLFDTCLNVDTAKKLNKAIGKDVVAVLNTHSHADHIGGNSFFESRYGCKTYIHKNELSFCSLTELESALLYGGASFKKAKSKFLCAKSINNVSTLDNLENKDIEVVELFGHSPGHCGFKINNTLYAGDAIFSKEVIEKHKILYIYDVKEYINSLYKLKEIEFENIIFCHKGILSKDEANSLIDENLNHTITVGNMIRDTLKKRPLITGEDISADLMKDLNIPFEIEYFLLVSSTIKGYLKYLEDIEKVAPVIDNGVKWKLL
ncbi:MBL fold metallo-hydrolase [Deferribacterales bacterium Es71-Z0220]|uniref:MBL fold metallo-hydrolase n=1 Tax=Deferrivibrio essentukiensis TaxID=2880922 RepID=UPI001F605742|nr:MBL fold metallo-hydrolase [Deferrivibrio essentukiensis]MCB4205226.1 MBL fold metallo-hydrolase [Deferrivibrio essentukiensis]